MACVCRLACPLRAFDLRPSFLNLSRRVSRGTSMEWSPPTTGLSTTDFTSTIAADPFIRCDVRCILKEVAPWLPFTKDPANPDKLLVPYSPVSALVWPAFRHDSSIDANTDLISEVLLAPDAIHDAIEKLKALGFAIKKYPSPGALVAAIEEFASDKLDAALVLQAKHLDHIARGAAAQLPKDPLKYAADLVLCNFANPSSGSYATLSLFEVASCPRIGVKDRWATSAALQSIG